MAEIFSLRPSEHESVQKLLPWHINGTLSARESDRVEAHLGECEECRVDLALERKLARGVAMMPLNADDGWQAMQLQMNETPPVPMLARPFAPFRRSAWAGWAVAGALAASVAVTAVVTSVRPTPVSQRTYHALGSPAVSAEGQAIVLFKPDTTEQQMRAVLSATKARLIDGPTASGAYVLRFENGDAGAAIDNLRGSAQVVLAEPLANDGRP